MADYKVIICDENPKWQKGCPLRIVKTQVSRNVETAEAYLQVRVQNISNNCIGRFVLNADITKVGSEKLCEQITCLDADVPAKCLYDIPAFKLSNPDLSAIEISVAEIDQSKDWANEPLEDFPSRPVLSLTQEAADERKKRLESFPKAIESSAVLYAHEEHGKWWLCSCGTANVGTETCNECGMSLKGQAELEGETQLEQWAKERAYNESVSALKGNDIEAVKAAKIKLEKLAKEQYKDAEELAEKCDPRIQEIEVVNAERREQKKKKMTRITAIAVVVIIVVCIFSGMANTQKAEKVAQAIAGDNFTYGTASTSSSKYTISFVSSSGNVVEKGAYKATESYNYTTYESYTYYQNGKKKTGTKPVTKTGTKEVDKLKLGQYAEYTVKTDFFGNVTVELNEAISCQGKTDKSMTVTLDNNGEPKSVTYGGNVYTKS